MEKRVYTEYLSIPYAEGPKVLEQYPAYQAAADNRTAPPAASFTAPSDKRTDDYLRGRFG